MGCLPRLADWLAPPLGLSLLGNRTNSSPYTSRSLFCAFSNIGPNALVCSFRTVLSHQPQRFTPVWLMQSLTLLVYVLPSQWLPSMFCSQRETHKIFDFFIHVLIPNSAHGEKRSLHDSTDSLRLLPSSPNTFHRDSCSAFVWARRPTMILLRRLSDQDSGMNRRGTRGLENDFE